MVLLQAVPEIRETNPVLIDPSGFSHERHHGPYRSHQLPGTWSIAPSVHCNPVEQIPTYRQRRASRDITCYNSIITCPLTGQSLNSEPYGHSSYSFYNDVPEQDRLYQDSQSAARTPYLDNFSIYPSTGFDNAHVHEQTHQSYQRRMPRAIARKLEKWFSEHNDNPYPTPTEKRMLMNETNLHISEVD